MNIAGRRPKWQRICIWVDAKEGDIVDTYTDRSKALSAFKPAYFDLIILHYNMVVSTVQNLFKYGSRYYELFVK